MAKLEVGAKMPGLIFDTPWESGLDFYKAAAEGGKKYTVVKFLRYLGCRNCQIDILDMEENMAVLESAGANCFVVLQSARETLQEAYADKKPPFTFICDPDMSFYKQLEIGDQDRQFSDPVLDAKKAAYKEKMAALGLVHGKYEGNEEQAPACFITDRDMNVVYSHYGINSVDVPVIEELAEIIKKLG